MKALVLSCNTGEGHNAAGKAIKNRLIALGHTCDMVDVMSLVSKKTSKNVANVYINSAKYTPHLFGMAYNLGLLISSDKQKSPVYYANSLVAKYLQKFLKNNEYDIIFTPHLYPAEILTYMKIKNMYDKKFIAIGTDYTCIPFWEETNPDAIIVPHKDLIEEYVKRGVKRDIIYPFGIPVDDLFNKDFNKNGLRQRARYLKKDKIYLVMGGSMGFGKIQLFVYELNRKCLANEKIIVICGTNEKLKRRLQLEFRNNKKIKIKGYCKNIYKYMKMCDVVFTKPGGLTSTEAAVSGIPIVHTEPIPGCETKNREFFNKRNMSYSSKSICEAIQYGKKLAYSKDEKNSMIRSQKDNTNANCADDIINLAIKMINSKG